MGARRHPEPMTVEEFYRIPDDGLRHELVAGFVVSEPLSGYPHGRIAAAVVEYLRAYVRTHRLGSVLTVDTGFILSRNPDTVRGPDVAFVSKARSPDRQATGAFEGPPDLAVEVLSPSDRAGDVRAKVAEYLSAGTRLVWVVDPETESVTAYRSLFRPRVFGADETLEGEDVIPGFRVTVRDLFEE